MPTNKDYIITMIMSVFVTILIISVYDRVVSRFINHQITEQLDRHSAIHLCLGHDSLSACDYVEELGTIKNEEQDP